MSSFSSVEGDQEYICNSNSMPGSLYSLEILLSSSSFGSLGCWHLQGDSAVVLLRAGAMLWKLMELLNTVQKESDNGYKRYRMGL